MGTRGHGLLPGAMSAEPQSMLLTSDRHGVRPCPAMKAVMVSDSVQSLCIRTT